MSLSLDAIRLGLLALVLATASVGAAEGASVWAAALPDREMMNSSLILDGPGVEPGKLEGVRMVDIAPTLAQWLGLRLEHAEGKPLVKAAGAQVSESER